MTTLISYAQNFEDVMLWRALKHVEKGFYIDLGAQDPVIDSVSLAFYERGWTGIHVEPTPSFAQLLRQQRPNDTVIQAVVGNESDILLFYEIPNTGISTAYSKIAKEHRERGFDIQEITVPSIKLSSIFKSCGKRQIHWMKIDVEGAEKSVLESWGKSAARPWIVLIEATLPLSQIENHNQWEFLIVELGYKPIYFDGLNRYYLSNKHMELASAFGSPPNVFDGFAMSGTNSTSIHHAIQSQFDQKLGELTNRLRDQGVMSANEIAGLKSDFSRAAEIHEEKITSLAVEVNSYEQQLLELDLRRDREKEEYDEERAQLRMQIEQLHVRIYGLEKQYLEQQVQHGVEVSAQALNFFNAEKILTQQLAQQELNANGYRQSASEKVAQMALDNAKRVEANMREMADREQHARMQLMESHSTAAAVLQRQRSEFHESARELNLKWQKEKNDLLRQIADFRIKIDDSTTKVILQSNTVTALREEMLKREREHNEKFEQVNREFNTALETKTDIYETDIAKLCFHNDEERLIAEQHSDLKIQMLSEALKRRENEIGAQAGELDRQVQFGKAVHAKFECERQKLDVAQSEKIFLEIRIKQRELEIAGMKAELMATQNALNCANVSAKTALDESERRVIILKQMHADTVQSVRGFAESIIQSTFEYRDAGVTMSLQLDEVKSAREMFNFEGGAFVKIAYRYLLKRAADESGYQNYYRQIRLGKHRIEVVRDIALSSEGRAIDANLDGLQLLILMLALGNIPYIGFLFKRIVLWLSGVLLDADSGTTARKLVAEVENLKSQQTIVQEAIAKLVSSPVMCDDSSNILVTVLPLSSKTPIIVAASEPQIEDNSHVLSLDADGSVAEPTWLTFLASCYENKLLGPVRRAGTPPPNAKLVVVVDCYEFNAEVALLQQSKATIAHLVEASEYKVEVAWRCESKSIADKIFDQGIVKESILNSVELGSKLDDHDLVLWLQPGDEVRPELHIALKLFDAFVYDVVLFDMSFRDEGKIFPWLLHGVDKVHASFVDYFFGRYLANGRTVKALEHKLRTSCGCAFGAKLISGALDSYFPNGISALHIAVPLVTISINLGVVTRMREFIDANVNSPKISPLGSKSRSPNQFGTKSRVSVVICTKDCGFLLRQLVTRLLTESLVLEIIIVSNNSTSASAIATLSWLKDNPKCQLLRCDGAFNFSKQSNLGAHYAAGDALLFLNDDITPVSNNWLELLCEWIDEPCVVGPMLLYPNERVQHAGMFLGFNGVAGHNLRHAIVPGGQNGFFLSAPRQVSCITGAALLMPKSIFKQVNGFDEMLGTYLQDVDFCQRIAATGYRLILDPRSVLIHMESVSVIPKLADPLIQKARELEHKHYARRWHVTQNKDAWTNPLLNIADESMRSFNSRQ